MTLIIKLAKFSHFIRQEIAYRNNCFDPFRSTIFVINQEKKN